VTQSSVSRAVAGLEAALGTAVLTRSTRSVVPTDVGRAVLDRARVVLAEVDRLRAVAAADSGTLRVGYAWASLGRHTSPVLRSWAREHPLWTLTFAQHHTPTSGLAEGLCDVAIVRVPVPTDRFATADLWAERRYAVLASDDPLARRRSLVLADLRDRPVAVNRISGTTSLDLWPAGQGPSRAFPVVDTEGWLTAIAAGQTVGVTAEATAVQHRRAGVSYRLLRDAPVVPVRYAWRRRSAPAGLDRLLAVTRAIAGC
jgi:DNA-binding transcriptional LysR family regulator